MGLHFKRGRLCVRRISYGIYFREYKDTYPAYNIITNIKLPITALFRQGRIFRGWIKGEKGIVL